MNSVANKLQGSRFFSHLSEVALAGLLEEAVEASGEAGAPLHARPADFVIVLEGGLEMRSREGRLLATVNADQAAGELGVLHAIPQGARLTLTRPSQVLIMDGERLDDILSHAHQRASVKTLDDGVGRRVASLVHTQPFAQMTLDHICRCAEAMTRRDVAAGDEVIRYADRGDYFYVLESGEAEVWRPDPWTGEVSKVATLGPGATFGEEALLRRGFRNATVRMSKPGSLLRLTVGDFERLLAGHFIQEIDADAAHALLASKKAELVDCRYPDEHEVWRIPGSRLIPLDTIRRDAGTLDSGRQYLVYCTSGRRSRAAAFLLRQLGLNAVSVRGGIAQWPYEYERQGPARVDQGA
jgi:rhodanese-related sulfurtransferase